MNNNATQLQIYKMTNNFATELRKFCHSNLFPMKALTSLLFIFLTLHAASDLTAQKIIKGKVSTQQGEPISGANVLIHQNLTGTVSDAEGYYELTVPENLELLTLEWSYLGYRSVLRTIDLTKEHDNEISLDIQLNETDVELGEVTVSARFTQEREQVPYAISVVTKNQFAKLGSTNLSQAIASTPGVYFSSFGNGVSKPVVRGLTNNNMILLDNGIKQEAFNFSSNHPFLIDEFASDRIEVIKGPASLQYGSDAVGGIVNVVRERPANPETVSGDFTSQYNTNTIGFVNNLGVKASGNTFFGGLRAGYKTHEDFTDGNGDEVYNTRFNEFNLAANLGIRVDRGIFSINYSYTRPKYGVQNGASENLSNNYPELLKEGRENQVWYQDLTNHLISSNNSIFLGKNTLDVDFGYQMNTRDLVAGGYNEQTGQVVAPTVVSMQLNTFTYNVKWGLPLNENRLFIGINGANADNDADETKPGNPVLDSKVNDFGLYAIGDFPVNDRVNLAAGLRYDHRNMQSFPIPTATTNRFEIDNTYDNVNGSFGVTYSFAKGQVIKANLASGFRSPSIPELTQNGIHAGRYERGDPNLDAQRNYQIDFNYHLHKSWVTFDITPFFNAIDNYIYLVQTDEDAPIGTGKIFQHTQNDASFYGGEIALDMHPLDWLGIHASYSMVRAKIEDDPEGYEYPTFIPQDRLGVELRLDKDQIGSLKRSYFSFETLYFLEQDRTGQNETPSPDYTLLNVRMGTSLTLGSQMIDVFLNANNLLDETYIDHLSVTKPLELNMIGRNIVLGLRIPFSFDLDK